MDVYRIKKSFLWFAEYVLIAATIMECNSLLLLELCTESTVNMQSVFTMVIITTSVVLLLLKLSDSKNLKLYIEKFFPVIVAMELYAIIYFFLGVYPSQNQSVKKDYIEKFLLMLPLYASLLFVERKEENRNKNRLIFKYSNVVCIIAFINLIVYYTSVVYTNELDSEMVYLRWYNGGELSSLVNCLNVCYLKLGTQAQSFNIQFLRDFGPFVEPLMFLIPLGTAIFVEFFLRGKHDKWCLGRCLLLSVAIFTVQSTYGLMLLIIAWGLKLLSLCNGKEKRIVLFPVTGAVALGCGYFLLYKMRQHNGAGLMKYLMGNKHFTDYVYAIKAFLSKPLLAGGYLNDDLTRSFFSEEAMEDIGFSNSIAVVLGQGGIVLGVLCMLPFLLGLIQLISKANRKFALFMVGPLFLYTVTVFHYRYFLIFIFALGYSLLEIERVKGGPFKLKVIQEEPFFDYGENEPNSIENIKAIVRTSGWKEYFLLVILASFAVCFGARLWDFAYKALYYFQLTSGQSGIRVLYGIVSLVAFFAWLRVLTKDSMSTKQKHIGIIYAITVQIGYACVYNTIYAYVDTAVQLGFGDRELVRETFVLVCYFASIVVAHVFFRTVFAAIDNNEFKNLLFPIGTVGLIILSLSVGDVAFSSYLRTKIQSIETNIEPLKKVIQVKDGKFFSDETPVLYKLALDDVSYGVVRGDGYRVVENATILEPKEKELPVLFDAGYQVAEISEDKIIYTNDEGVIAGLSKEGYKFYRYYAFGHERNLEDAARLNGLDIIEDGGKKLLLIDGAEKSLIYGPYEVLNPGTYTVSFSLKINPEDYSTVADDEVIASVRTSHMYGKRIDHLLGVTFGEFDEDGCLTVNSSLTVGSVGEGYEYLVFGKDNYSVGVSKIEIRQTPKFITKSNYNVHQKPIYEEYYDLDGNPFEVSRGYYGCEYEYDDRDLVVMQRFLGKDFKPVLTTLGYAEVHKEYNVNKKVTKESYYGINREPIDLPDGYHSVEKKYDSSGNCISEAFYDRDGNPAMVNDAYFRCVRVFNKDKRWIRTEYYDTDGSLALQKDKYAVIERDYDEAGNVAEERYYGVQNEPVLYGDKFHIIRSEFNEKKQCIKEMFYGIDGEPVSLSGSYSGYERSYDDAGNIIKTMYLGTDEKPVITDWGYACWRRSFNSKKQIIREEYFDIDGSPVLISGKYAMVDFNYDENGKMIKKTFKGMDGKVVDEQIVEG